MPNTPIPAGSLAVLNDNELEILHLLANGHTAKSIAASLGRSETAINERLREARRKTGVGSSRELARLLDAQKIWDKNIDLSAGAPSGDTPDQPRTMGLERTKGRIAMMIALPAALLGLALVAGTTDRAAEPAPPAAVAATSSPLVGTWALDLSRIPEAERPQAVTISFAVASDGQWTSHVEITDPDGTKRFADSTARTDGVAVPVTGTMAFIDTVSLRQPEANTLVMTLGKNGKPFATRVYTIADDHQTMTETIIWPGEAIPRMETAYFDRIG
jgi:DNA-binding CsgD family transcriptional regulator